MLTKENNGETPGFRGLTDTRVALAYARASDTTNPEMNSPT
jgi:hypothetical protein